MRGCNCSFMIEKGWFIEWVATTGIANQLNTFHSQIHCIYAIHGCKCSSKNIVSNEEWMAAATCRKTETLYPEEDCFLWLNAESY